MLLFLSFFLFLIIFGECSSSIAFIEFHLCKAFAPISDPQSTIKLFRSDMSYMSLPDRGYKVNLNTEITTNNLPFFLKFLKDTFFDADITSELGRKDIVEEASTILILIMKKLVLSEDKLARLNHYMKSVIKMHGTSGQLFLPVFEYSWIYKTKKNQSSYKNLDHYQNSNFTFSLPAYDFDTFYQMAAAANSWKKTGNRFREILRHVTLARYANHLDKHFGFFALEDPDVNAILENFKLFLPKIEPKDRILRRILKSNLTVKRSSKLLGSSHPRTGILTFRNGEIRIPPVLRAFIKYIILPKITDSTDWLHALLIDYCDFSYELYTIFFRKKQNTKQEVLRGETVTSGFIKRLYKTFLPFKFDDDMVYLKSQIANFANMLKFFLIRMSNLPCIHFLNDFEPGKKEYDDEKAIRIYINLLPNWLAVCLSDSHVLENDHRLEHFRSYLKSEIMISFKVLEKINSEKCNQPTNFFSEKDLVTLTSVALLNSSLNRKT